MANHDRRKNQGRKESGAFLPVPADVLNSSNFLTLSLKAKALILDLGAAYNGFNNGDLAAAYSMMQARGWRSKDTLGKAISELLHAGMIEKTRQGGLHGPSLYAVTWRPIDECKGKLDVKPTKVASGKWRLQNVPATVLKTQSPPRYSGQSDPIIGQDRSLEAA